MARVVVPLNFNAFLEKAKLKRERDEYDVTARDSLECVYARGSG